MATASSFAAYRTSALSFQHASSPSSIEPRPKHLGWLSPPASVEQKLFRLSKATRGWSGGASFVRNAQLIEDPRMRMKIGGGYEGPDGLYYLETKVSSGPTIGLHQKEKLGHKNSFGDDFHEESDWDELDADLYRWTIPLRPVQWYPGHIAKTEKELKQQLKLMDVVIEVRDARIPMATSHPQMDSWIGNRKRILVLNREDMISPADRNAWAAYFSRQGIKAVFANGQLGMGTMKLGRLAKSLASDVNDKRRAKGLLPRAVRAGIVGYPNVGKSSLINRLLKRRMCPAAPRPGVTRELRWVRYGKDLELLDSPGILPMRINDQVAAIKLAICDDIGERSYDVADVAAILVDMLKRIPEVGAGALYKRYKIDADGGCGKTFIEAVSMQLFGGDANQAAFRILTDFRKGKFGWISLERPPR